MLTFGSLFAGIGGFDLGLERASMVCKWQVEINPFCQQVLAKHWPDVMRYADVKDCGKHNLATVDLIAGGFPCQPHSNAGQQKGAEDDRDLWPEMYRVIRELRPTWVLAENVLGIKGTILNSCLSDLESEGYWNYRDRWGRHRIAPLVIPACAFNAPHKRERVFIVAYSKCNGLARGQLWETSCQSWNEAIASEPFLLPAWPPGPGEIARIPRMAHGVPDRVDRVAALGNAVVPQVVEWLGRRIVEVENGRT